LWCHVTAQEYRLGMKFERGLLAAGPASSFASELALFGRFIGRWQIRNDLFSESTGAWSRTNLEWSFAWVIDGRGIQDVLVDETGSAIGTTVRTWDSIGGWRVVWFCPRAAEHVVLSAAPDGADIRLDGVQADGRPVRWVFSALKQNSFAWDGWCSNDGGRTWWHEQHMEARRLND
jgi:hypothetical protein